MYNFCTYKEKLHSNLRDYLRMLIHSRWIFTLAVLGLIVLPYRGFSAYNILPGIIIAICELLANVIYWVYLPKINNLKNFFIFQILIDVLAITIAVHYYIGIESLFVFFYILLILLSILFISRHSGFVIATVCSLFYTLLVILEYYSVIGLPNSVLGIKHFQLNNVYIFFSSTIKILFFYVIAYMAGHFRDKMEQMGNELDFMNIYNLKILENIAEGLFVTDINDVITVWTYKCTKYTGIPYETAIEKNLYDILPEFKKLGLDRSIEKVKTSGKELYVTEAEIKLSKNIKRKINIRIYPLHFEGKLMGVITMMLNIN